MNEVIREAKAELKRFEPHTGKKRVLIDMDGVLCDYIKERDKRLEENPYQPFPQTQIDFWIYLEPIDGALDAYRRLEENFDVRILTAPSFLNPESYTGKRIWVEKHLGLRACKMMVLAYDKSIVKGDYLIDDRDVNGQPHFEGEWIEFPPKDFGRSDWEEIVQKIEKENGIETWNQPL